MRMTLAVVLLGLLIPAFIGSASEGKPAQQPVKIAFSEDDFRNDQPHKTKEVTLKSGDTLIVELGSNPTTGFSWNEQAVNSDMAVLKQVHHERVSPKAKRPGAGGSQEWTFEAVKPGTATLNFSYGRPWEGGEKGTWTLKVVVKIQ